MKDPNYAPVYCAMYPELATIAREHGYALAIHGTLARDMDLICVPWTDTPGDPRAVLDAITKRFAVEVLNEAPNPKPHGRQAWTISICFGECAIDLSFMPSLPTGAMTSPRRTAMDQDYYKQAEALVETVADLQRRVLVKYMVAVLEEMHDQLKTRDKEIERLRGAQSGGESPGAAA